MCRGLTVNVFALLCAKAEDPVEKARFYLFPGRLPYPNAGETEWGGPRASPVGSQVGSKFVFLVLFINITTAVKTHFENPGIPTHCCSFYSVPLQSLSFCEKK